MRSKFPKTLLILATTIWISACAANSPSNPLNAPAVEVDKARVEKVVAATNGCEWAKKMSPPDAAITALRAAQDSAATPEEKQKLRAFRERIVAQDMNYKANCEKGKTNGN